MTTTTTSFTYRAQTDQSTPTWHLGADEKGAVCFCGCRLMTPDDTRAFALKVPAADRNYQTDPDVAKVTCGSCKRNRGYASATSVQPVHEGQTAEMNGLNRPRPSRRRGRRAVTGDPRADRTANAEAAEAGK